MRRPRLSLLLVLALVGLIAVGLGSGVLTGGRQWPGVGQIRSAGRQPAGTLIYARPGDFDSLDPLLQADPMSWELTVSLFEGLLELDGRLRPRPALAQSWHLASDGLSYTFRLKEGVRYHDGTLLDARDVELTYYAFLDPSSTSFRRPALAVLRGVPGYQDALGDLGKRLEREEIDRDEYERLRDGEFERLLAVRPVEALDGLTVRFNLEVPGSPFLTTAADLPVLPGGSVGLVPVGTGPFRLSSHEPGHRVVIEADPDHHRGPPLLERVEYRVMPDENLRLDALVSGEAHMTAAFAAHAADLDLLGHPVYAWPVPGYVAVALNLSDPLLSAARLRQALSLAVDRVALVERVYRGYGAPAVCPLPPGGPDAYAAAGSRTDSYQAAELLDAEGWIRLPSGDRYRGESELEVWLTYPDECPWDQVASHVAWCWGRIGVRAVPDPVPAAELASRLAAGDFAAAVATSAGSTDPLLDLERTYGTGGEANLTGYSNPTVDGWLEEARAIDGGSRDELCRKVADQLSTDAPQIYLARAMALYATVPGISGLRTHPAGPWALFYSLRDVSAPDG